MNGHKGVRAVIRGHVQGVGFRGWTEHKARMRGLDGWVRNRADGTVEALFGGPAEAVEAMLTDCRRGPRSGRVDEVTVTDAEAPPPGSGFAQRKSA